MSGYDRERVERIVGEFKARNMAEGGAVEGGYDQLNSRILKALIKKYGSEAKAREMFRTLDGGELMRILKEAEGYAEGGPVLQDYADPYAEMSLPGKLGELVKGAGKGLKYMFRESKAYAGHLQAPEVFAKMLRERYPELGAKRVDRGPLDAAINFAGGYDWAARPEVSAEDARAMALQYQLRDYMKPSRTKSNEVADYAQNLAGVEQALADKEANIKRDRKEIAALAREYAQRESGAQRVTPFADGGPVLPADRATGYRAPGQRPDDRLARFGSSFAKSLPGAAQGVATGYADMLSALNTYLYQLEPAEQIALLKQLPAGLRNMVLSGVESVKQLPAKVAAATPESAGQFSAQLTAEMLLDPTRGVGKTVPTTQVIKPKGGNWPAYAAEHAAESLKTPRRVPALTMGDELRIDASLLMRPERLVQEYQKYLDELDLDDPRNQDKAYQLQQEIESESRNAALDTWLDQKLAKYVKNELASPDDPIRKQVDEFAVKKKQLLEQKEQQINKAMLDLEKARAERGFTPEMLTRSQARLRELRRERDYIARQSGSHINARELELANRWVPESLPDMRERLGYEVQGIGETPLGKGWENMADLSIKPTMAGNITDEYLTETNPWLAKVPPETKVYQIDNDQFADLGFGHMRDELRNALDPESDLPDALKITPDKLKMLNMAQASKLVDDINAFRATRATEVNAARAGNIATVPVKEYPEQGLKWVELKMPEPEFEPGHGPGPVSGYPSLHGIIDQKTGQSVSAGATPEEARNLYKREERKKALEDALKYEGEMLKHCVGGYCEDVVQGRSRIFSLRDDDGRPRVTIEVQPNSGQKMTFEQAKRAIEDDPLTANLDDNVKMEMLYNQGFLDEEGNVLPDLPMQIIQVKGAGNKKPQPEDIPLVQDFIRSGKYEIAGDERNTGFVKLPKDNMMIAALKRTGNKPPALRSEAGDYFLTEDEHKRLSEWFDKGTAQGFLAPEFAYGGAVKMAAGGKVGYNPAVVDEIVNRVREKLNG